jgi:antitoxin component of RelBE/YafQ-DinJ toxin-antitoxin module
VLEIYASGPLLSSKERSEEQLDMLSERTKLTLLSFLLLLMLGFLVFTTTRTFQAAHNFQQQYSAIKTENVSAVRPWMTVHVIAHVYHVPEKYLYRSLTISNQTLFRHATLYQIAARKRLPVDQVIHTIKDTILTYHKQRSAITTVTFKQQNNSKLLSPISGRTAF